MRKILLILAGTLGLFAAQAQDKGGVEWLGTEHDFGAFSEDDGPVDAVFRFVNRGTKPVAITNVRSNCGCTTPDYSRKPISPSDTGMVQLTYNPTGRPGRFNKRAVVTFSGDAGQQSLKISGVVVGAPATLQSRYPVDAAPLRLRTTVVPFGTLSNPGAKTEYMEVYNASVGVARPCFENLPKWVRVLSVADTVAPGEYATYALIADAAGAPLYGVVTDSLSLIPDYGANPLKIDVVGIFEEDFSRLTPGQLAKAPQVRLEAEKVDFGTFAADGGAVSRTLKISNAGKSDLAIRRAYSLDPGISVEMGGNVVRKGKSTQLTIILDPSRLPSEILDSRVTVLTNDPANPSAVIRVVGINQLPNLP